MYRSSCELAVLVRHRIAYLGDEREACSPIDRGSDRPASLMTLLRHRLGIALIQVGQGLAGADALRGLPTSPARPAAWGPGS
jgi:hypothetical protein